MGLRQSSWSQQMQKIGRELETAVADWITHRFWWRRQGTGTGGSVAFICELYETQLHGSRYFFHAHSHSADSWEQSTVVKFMNRFPDTFQTVTDRSLFGQNVPHGTNTLTRWLTNSGCVARALSSLTHSSTVLQTIMSAMSQQLQSDLRVAGTSDPLRHRPPLPKLDIPAVDADEEPLEDGKQRTMSKVDHWIHVKSKMPVRRK